MTRVINENKTKQNKNLPDHQLLLLINPAWINRKVIEQILFKHEIILYHHKILSNKHKSGFG